MFVEATPAEDMKSMAMHRNNGQRRWPLGNNLIARPAILSGDTRLLGQLINEFLNSILPFPDILLLFIFLLSFYSRRIQEASRSPLFFCSLLCVSNLFSMANESAAIFDDKQTEKSSAICFSCFYPPTSRPLGVQISFVCIL